MLKTMEIAGYMYNRLGNYDKTDVASLYGAGSCRCSQCFKDEFTSLITSSFPSAQRYKFYYDAISLTVIDI